MLWPSSTPSVLSKLCCGASPAVAACASACRLLLRFWPLFRPVYACASACRLRFSLFDSIRFRLCQSCTATFLALLRTCTSPAASSCAVGCGVALLLCRQFLYSVLVWCKRAHWSLLFLQRPFHRPVAGSKTALGSRGLRDLFQVCVVLFPSYCYMVLVSSPGFVAGTGWWVGLDGVLLASLWVP